MNTAAFRKTYPSGFSLEMPALELRPGELTAVIGANGSGKSTLARVLSGIERADGGARVLSGATVGYLPQKCFAFRMSVEKNILLGGAELQRFAELTRLLGLEPLLKQRAKRLSGGECARMALARLLMGHRDLLIMDEPCAAMDMESTIAAEDILRRRCAEEGCAVLLITHSLQQARRCAQNVLFLQKGRLVEQGRSEEILTNPKTPELGRFLEFYGA